MAQKRIKINDVEIWQPDEELDWNFEETYTQDSGRTQDGVNHITPMFTTQSFGYRAKEIPAAECAKILQMIRGNNFKLYAFSPYYGEWKTMTCSVGKGSLKQKTLIKDGERMSSLSFNMVDKNPLR